jgi:rhamnosyltransferase
MTTDVRLPKPPVPASIVILTRNAVKTLPRTLTCLQEQTVRPLEIIIIDSNSQDGTRAAAQGEGIRLIDLPPDEFNHGATRDLAASLARGEIIVYLVGDAIPIGSHWLTSLLQPFADKSIAIVQAVEDPQSKSYFWERPYSNLFNFTGEHRRWVRQYKLGYSNVCAGVRREVIREYRFGPAPFAEDKIFQRRVHAHGWRAVLQPEARVSHNHRYDWEHLRDRIQLTGYGFRLAGMGYGTFNLLTDQLLGLFIFLLYLLPLGYRHLRAHLARIPPPLVTEWIFPLVRPYLIYRGFRMSHEAAVALVYGKPTPLRK